jgi:hypothetical protein
MEQSENDEENGGGYKQKFISELINFWYKVY